MKKLLLITAILIISGCKSASQKTLNVADFLDVDAIEKAEIRNNAGTFFLNTKQLKDLKTALKKMSYESDIEIYPGAKGVVLTINKKQYHLVTRTNGESAEISVDGKALVFKTNGLNLDNYERN